MVIPYIVVYNNITECPKHVQTCPWELSHTYRKKKIILWNYALVSLSASDRARILKRAVIVKIWDNVKWRWHVVERNFTEFAVNTIELAIAVQTTLFIFKSQKHACTHLLGYFECPWQNSVTISIMCPQRKSKPCHLWWLISNSDKGTWKTNA